MKKVFLLFITVIFYCLLSAQTINFSIEETTPATDANCDGTITVRADSPAGPFRLTLDADASEPRVAENVNGTFIFDNVCPGEHTIMIDFMDYPTCYNELVAVVDQEICGGDNQMYIKAVTPSSLIPDGTISVVASGDKAPYTVQLVRISLAGDNRTQQNVNGEHIFIAGAGTYEITITSMNNPSCTITYTVVVPPSNCSDIVINKDRITVSDAYSCSLSTGRIFGNNSGNPSLPLFVSGAYLPIIVSLIDENGTIKTDDTFDFTGLAQGVYTLRVEDSYGCTAETSITINSKDFELQASIPSKNVCSGSMPMGEIKIEPQSAYLQELYDNGTIDDDLTAEEVFDLAYTTVWESDNWSSPRTGIYHLTNLEAG